MDEKSFGERIEYEYGFFHCSVCGRELDEPEQTEPYCPNCMAKMTNHRVNQNTTMLIRMTDKEIAEIKNMPIFNAKCHWCGAMCFDDDAYCSNCGRLFDGED